MFKIIQNTPRKFIYFEILDDNSLRSKESAKYPGTAHFTSPGVTAEHETPLNQFPSPQMRQTWGKARAIASQVLSSKTNQNS